MMAGPIESAPHHGAIALSVERSQVFAHDAAVIVRIEIASYEFARSEYRDVDRLFAQLFERPIELLADVALSTRDDLIGLTTRIGDDIVPNSFARRTTLRYELLNAGARLIQLTRL